MTAHDLPSGRPFYAELDGLEPVIAWIWPGPEAHWTRVPPCIRETVGMDAHHVFPAFLSGKGGPSEPVQAGCAVLWAPNLDYPLLIHPAEVRRRLSRRASNP